MRRGRRPVTRIIRRAALRQLRYQKDEAFARPRARSRCRRRHWERFVLRASRRAIAVRTRADPSGSWTNQDGPDTVVHKGTAMAGVRDQRATRRPYPVRQEQAQPYAGCSGGRQDAASEVTTCAQTEATGWALSSAKADSPVNSRVNRFASPRLLLRPCCSRCPTTGYHLEISPTLAGAPASQGNSPA